MFIDMVIPNLVSGYVLGSQSVTYCVWVTETLTSKKQFQLRFKLKHKSRSASSLE